MNKAIRFMFYFILSVFGGLIGYRIANYMHNTYQEFRASPLNLWSFVLLGILMGIALTPLASDLFMRLIDSVVSWMKKISIQEIVLGSIGLIFGLIVSTMMNVALGFIPFEKIEVIGEFIKPFLYIIVTVFWGYLGIFFTTRMAFVQSMSQMFSKGDKSPKTGVFNNTRLKILDTSVIVDGRIYDISKTGFLEGTLVVPKFVLNELQQIADSADYLKRNRGRRGLDILHNLRNDPGIQIIEKDFDSIGVDAKLVKLGMELGGDLLTTDYNLNKVASLQGIRVLNINELANAVKPVVLPGEEMEVSIIKEGKEAGQGIGYLDDGTMIVVEEGRRHLGEKMPVEVTSVIQTVAGKMIFAKLKNRHRRKRDE